MILRQVSGQDKRSLQRPPEWSGLTAIAQVLLVATLIAFGYRLLRRSERAEHTDHGAA